MVTKYIDLQNVMVVKYIVRWWCPTSGLVPPYMTELLVPCFAG